MGKLVLFALMLISFGGFPQPGNPKATVAVRDSLTAWNPSAIKLSGYLGSKIDLCIGERIEKQDFGHLIEPFRTRTEGHLWQTEFWGKWILSAVAAWQYNQNPDLLATIQQAASELINTQTDDGYLGNYSAKAQLQQWDIWGRKYTLLGLLACRDVLNDPKILVAAQKLADHLLTQVGPGKANIVKTGNYRGMPSSSILEPVVLLYRETGEKRYLDFARYIVAQWETADGPQLIRKAFAGTDVAERFPKPESWWSWENGQKAYEMMSCYEGLLELYRITGEPDYLRATEAAVKNIVDTEINAAGSGTAFECFYHGALRQTEPGYHTMETCVTFTWMKLCNNLLRLTANPFYAEQIEKTMYNTLLASMKFDGSQIAKYSPLEGSRQAGEEQCGMHINCCNANGPRAFTLIPRMALMSGKNEIVVNLYAQSDATIRLDGKNEIVIHQETTYPESGQIEIAISPEKPEKFTLALRIPGWSSQTSVSVNGGTPEQVTGGDYFRITRNWQKGDKVKLNVDLSGRLVLLNGYQALSRGPVLLARDSRFDDGFVDEAAVIQHRDDRVELTPSSEKPEHVWMSFTAPLVLGTDLEGEYRNPKSVHFCDFASAGNTWDRATRYRVWIRQTLNAMNSGYHPY